MLSEDSQLLRALSLASSGLRSPQHEALEALADAIDRVGATSFEDISAARLAEQLASSAGWTQSPRDLAEADMALATGVGKSRLAGAIIEFLALAGVSKTFLILTHRDLLRRRWRELLALDSPLCVLPQLAKAREHVRVGSTSAEIGPVDPSQVVVVIQTVQALNSPKRTWSDATWFSPDLAQTIAERNDLVVLFDESHHLAASKAERGWRSAVMATNPKLLIGLTATPHEGRHIAYEYGLKQLLREQLYSKALAFSVAVDGPQDEEQGEQLALQLGIQLTAEKRAALDRLPEGHPVRLRGWRPVMLVATSSVDEASAAVERLKNEFGFEEDQILLITSKHRSDKDLERVLALDDPSNSRIAVVVAAFMLDEGWDVTSVSVITPLRSLNSVGNAKQIIGRGLRLPVGQRVGVEDLDRLDVVIVAQESLFEIKKEVKGEFGSTVPVEKANESRARMAKSVEGSGVYDCLIGRSPGVGDFEIPLLVVARISQPKAYPAEVRTSGNVLIDAATATVREMKLKSTASEVSIATAALKTWAPYLTDKEIFEFLEAVRPPDWAVSITALRKAIEQYMAGCSFSWLGVPTSRSVLDASLVCSSTRNPAAPRSAKSGWLGKDYWYDDWSKSAYSITQFDNEWEFEAAEFLDETPSVVWWLRNDPATLTVATPSHKRGHEPDFVVLDEEGALHLIEVKGQGYWEEHQRAVVPTLEAWAACLTEAGQPATYTTIPAENVTTTLVGLLSPAQ